MKTMVLDCMGFDPDEVLKQLQAKAATLWVSPPQAVLASGILGWPSMTSKTYSIDDAHSNQITTGLQEYEARRVAQRIANERGETVYMYADGEECEAVEPEVLQ